MAVTPAVGRPFVTASTCVRTQQQTHGQVATCPRAQIASPQSRIKIIATWSGGQCRSAPASLPHDQRVIRGTLECVPSHCSQLARKSLTYYSSAVDTRHSRRRALERAPDRVKAQFALLISQAESDNQGAGHLESFETSLNATGNPEIEGSELLESINSHIHEIVALG